MPMTVEVQILNKDANRRVEIREAVRNRETGEVVTSYIYDLAPGCSMTTHVHLLRDLIVREVEP
jgi:hypothetical protein